ncbi:MAG: sulfur carrier protein ThiS adenylyltransferase ThiF [Lachnospiraceae bacterium]
MQLSKEQLEQALLERYTTEMYQKISNAKVAVAGLGGLGSNVAVLLARAGVGTLFLVDFDEVELTNLNRQAYSISHIGTSKTEAMEEILKEINPYINIRTKKKYVTEKNALELFKEYPIVCEGFDKSENKAMLVNTLLEGTKDTILVSGTGMAGYGTSNTIQTKRKMQRLYLCGDEETELTKATCLMASRVTICAAHQANMIIRLILEIQEP